MSHLLEVKNLKTYFKLNDQTVKAVDDVSYHVNEGEIVAIVGESGSGKSVTQYSGIKLIPQSAEIVSGEVIFEGSDLLKYKENSEEMRKVRGGKIGVIFQEPMTSLNPVLTVGEQIMESVMLHKQFSRKRAKERAVELLNMVGIPDAQERVNHFPYQFSGGMRQRIMIAMAMSCDPKLLIADEATTALDVTTQAQLLELLKDIVKRTNTSIILVTHNLGIVARYADRIYVMYAGRIVESGENKDIFIKPKHPYTIGLLNSVPRLDDPKDRKLIPIEGLPPDLANKPKTCSFLDRCPFKMEACEYSPAPQLVEVDKGHYVSCYADIKGNDWNLKFEEEFASASEQVIMKKEWKSKENNGVILEVQNLKTYFPFTKGIFNRKIADIKAVDDVSFKVYKGETLGLVGESGCGKTTVARSIIRMYEPTDGKIIFNGTDIAKMSKRNLKNIRKNMSLVFQDPSSSLDPRQKVFNIIGEPLIINKLVDSKKELHERVEELMRLVGLDPNLKDRVPHEFSGGQRQRIGIARALASNPSFIVCDEAISALDVSIQAQIINLLEELQEKLGLTYLFIAHDLSVVRHIADRVAVMYLGKIVEIGDWKSLYDNPKHPYTKALLDAVPIPDPLIEEQREHKVLKGEVPSLLSRPKGCVFSNRCPIATDECREMDPPLSVEENGHGVACIKV
ncbi:peptide/nickel transport system ATP-binding protein [Evansella vedderi]|uniref:Peptide/nickel transport system ATP-binding protein n=1 Tax=Evansella vedderi TaxID=38282 RepID=A0ABU0A0U8_9BACI|nr:ABC transporter ATP-binding protein [Evansella vedderi]MDQ0257118.1 peptide/nickel transport system ATP-binding protein [Evansella vedderi]